MGGYCRFDLVCVCVRCLFVCGLLCCCALKIYIARDSSCTNVITALISLKLLIVYDK